MAISLVGSASGNAINGGNVTVTMPVGTAQGDVVYGAYALGTVSDVGMSVSTAGYTELTELYANDDNDTNFAVYRKVQGSTPDSSVVFVGTAGANDAVAGALMVLRGVDTTTPEDAVTTTATGVNGSIPNPPAITTVTANAWVLAIGGNTDSDVPTAPTNYSDLITDVGDDTQNATIMMARREIPIAGAEDPGSFQNIFSGVTTTWCAATVAVRAALGGGFPFRPDPFLPLLVR